VPGLAGSRSLVSIVDRDLASPKYGWRCSSSRASALANAVTEPCSGRSCSPPHFAY